MANPKHIEILNQGVEAWKAWRNQKEGSLEVYIDHLFDEDITPDLSGVDLHGRDLSRAHLSQVNFKNANLSGANLQSASLVGADLSGACLRDAQLGFVDFANATLAWADLSGASFFRTILQDTVLTGANFSNSWMFMSTLGNVDLSEVKNLDTVIHKGPSSMSLDTIYKSRGKIPERFLRGCGVPDVFITYIHSLTAEAIEFYSCFISHSSKDEEFARRLHNDLQSEGVRCWFGPENLKIGDRFRTQIDEAVRLYDKLLLVLSENSVKSQWVEKEVETAFEKEAEEGKTVLFPVQLDDAVSEIKTGWAADIRRTRHIGDFSDWKNHDSYKKAFERLMRDLKAGG